MPPDSSCGYLALPAFQADELDRPHRAIDALLGRNVPDLETEADIRQDGAIGEQREMLEHHAEGLLAERQQLLAVEPGDIDVVDENPAAGRLDEPVHAPQEGRLARAGQTHEDEDLALMHLEGDIAQSDDRTAGLGDVSLALSLRNQIDSFDMICAEDLADALQGNAAHVLPTS
jgi:hypothetical protein